MANLAQWDALEAVSSAAVDDASSPDLNKVWDDTFFQVGMNYHICSKYLNRLSEIESEDKNQTALKLEREVVKWIFRWNTSPCGAGSIPHFLALSDETLN